MALRVLTSTAAPLEHSTQTLRARLRSNVHPLTLRERKSRTCLIPVSNGGGDEPPCLTVAYANGRWLDLRRNARHTASRRMPAHYRLLDDNFPSILELVGMV